MAAVRVGVSSCGSTNTRRAGHLPPIPCNGDPTAAYCILPGSSASRSGSSRAVTCHAADAKPKPDVEASVGKSRKMPLAISATGGRGCRYGSRPASYGAGPLTHRPASPSPCIRGGDDYREPHGGEDASTSVTRRLEKGKGRLPARADFMKPVATLQNIRLQTTRHPSLLDKRGEIGAVSDRRFHNSRGKENEVYDQNNWQTETASSIVSSAREWSLESDGTFEGSNHKPSATPQNIRLQTPRHSLLDRRVDGVNQFPPRFIHKATSGRAYSSNDYYQTVGAIDATSDWSFPKVREEGDEGNGQDWLTDATPCIYSVDGAIQAPPRYIQKAAPATLMHQGHSHDCHQHMGAKDAIRDCIFPIVSEEKDEVDEQDQQTDTMSSRISSARDWNFELGGGRNHRAHLMNPAAMPRNIRIQIPRHPSLLDRRVDRIDQVPFMCGACSSENYHQHVGALDAINERRLPKSCVVITKCPRQSSFTASISRKSAPGPLGKVKDKSAIARSASAHTSGGVVSAVKKEAYITTLSAGGGYGDPHPPPFYKCEVCRKGTAFYRLKCCRLVVCERCGCACEPAEAVEDDMLQSGRGKVLAVKEKLPKVKLEGSDLFLWQPCSFPANLMLCMAKRIGNHLQYYFAPIDDLMNPEVKVIRATVYDFRQHGQNARSLSVRKELLMRKQLR